MKIDNFLKLVVSIIVCEVAGLIGSFFTAPVIRSGWYAMLAKPALNPPSWVFGPVWILLYALMGVSLYLVWARRWKVANPLWERSRKAWNPWSERLWQGDWQKQNIIAIFAFQLFLNAIWSPVFFGAQNPGAAFFIIVALWFSIVYLVINAYRVSKPAAWLLAPYLLWVSFAMYLNYSIWVLN